MNDLAKIWPLYKSHSLSQSQQQIHVQPSPNSTFPNPDRFNREPGYAEDLVNDVNLNYLQSVMADRSYFKGFKAKWVTLEHKNDIIS